MAKAKQKPKPPTWLVQKAARALWTKLHSDLTAARFLEGTDHAALGRYCQYMAEWVDLTDKIITEGWTYVTSSEHVEEMRRPNPAVRFRKDVESSLKALEDSLGLNPRYRMAITQALLSTKVQTRDPDLLDRAEESGAPDVTDPKSEWENLLAHGAKAN